MTLAALAPASGWSEFRDTGAPEDPGPRRHLTSCAACSRWATALDRLVGDTGAVPDVAGAAIARWEVVEGRRRDRGERAGRVMLALAGVAGLVLGVVSLLALPGGDAAHYGRDLLGFQLVFSVGFLLGAARPQRYVRALLPLTAAASLIVLLPSAADTASREVNILAEASHLPILFALAGLLLLARMFPGVRDRAGDRPTRVPTMAR